MNQILMFESVSHEDTEEIGNKIAQLIKFPSCIYLNAEMGLGKTTLCKSIIAGLGCQQTVTSPTYNLIQEYAVNLGVVYHMDLYRLDDPSELEFLALADLWSETSLFLIEWPQNGGRYLQVPTHQINIDISPETGVRNIMLESLLAN